MTTRESLHELVERLTDDEVEKLWAELAAERGIESRRKPAEPARWVDGREHPILAAIWDNDDDAIFDDL